MSPSSCQPLSVPFDHRALPSELDLVIIGNGPSALVTAFALSYTPYYAPTYPSYDTVVSSSVGQQPPPPHPDRVLHEKLAAHPLRSLFDHDLRDLALHCHHNGHSRAKTPLAALLDTLEKPNADTNPGGQPSRLIWVRNVSEGSCDRPFRQLSHAVLGKGPIGGSWFGMASDESEDESSWSDFQMDIDKVDMELEGARTLSYATDLELPGFPFANWLCNHRKRPHRTSSSSIDSVEDTVSLRAWSAITRPLRRDVARYYRDYAVATEIDDVMFEGVTVEVVELMEEALRRGECACTEITEEDFYQNVGPMDCQSCSRYRYLIRGRSSTGYGVSNFSIRTQSVVLATGTFETPRHLGVTGENEIPLVCHSVGDLTRVLNAQNGSFSCNSSCQSVDDSKSHILPVLIVGSGLSAADALIHLRDADVPLLHAFRSPDYFDSQRKFPATSSLKPQIRNHRGGHHVSPLAGCSRAVYPDYARLWALMKKASSAAPTLSFSQAMSWVDAEGRFSAGCCANIPQDPRGFKYLGLPDLVIKGFGPVIPASDSMPIDSFNVFLTQNGSSEEFAVRVCTAAVLIGKSITLSFLKGSIRRHFMRLKGDEELTAEEVDPIHADDYLECGLGDPAPCDPFTFRLGSAKHAESKGNDPARGIYVTGALAGETFVRFGALAGPVAVVSQLLQEQKTAIPAFGVKALSSQAKSNKYTPQDTQRIWMSSTPFNDRSPAGPTKMFVNQSVPLLARPILTAGFRPLSTCRPEERYPSPFPDSENRPDRVAARNDGEARSLPNNLVLPSMEIPIPKIKFPNVPRRPSNLAESLPSNLPCFPWARTMTRFPDHPMSRFAEYSPYPRCCSADFARTEVTLTSGGSDSSTQ